MEKSSFLLKRCISNDGQSLRLHLLVAAAILLYGFSVASFSRVMESAWFGSTTSVFIVTVIHALLGIALIFIFMKYLRSMDELQRKIQLDALAFSCGVAIVGGNAYWLSEKAGLVSAPDLSNLVAAIAISYAAANIFGHLRYQ